MRHDILAILQANERSFSKGQRRIAHYILESYDKAAFMTANILGKTVGVSESTVVRFAMELGYDGYPSMQKALQEVVVNRLTAAQRIEVTNSRIGDRDVLSTVFQSDLERLRQTSETIDRVAFDAAVNTVLGAERVFIIGVRSAAPLAGFLGYYLNYMFQNVHIITASGTGEMFEKIVGINERDAVIAFSFPRYSATTAKAAQYCRSRGVTVIGITDTKLSPLGEASDYVLTAKSNMLSLVDSLVAPMSVVNALIVAIAAKKKQELSQTFQDLEQIWEEYHIYEKQAVADDV